MFQKIEQLVTNTRYPGFVNHPQELKEINLAYWEPGIKGVEEGVNAMKDKMRKSPSGEIEITGENGKVNENELVQETKYIECLHQCSANIP